MSERGFKSRFTKYIDHDISYPCVVEKAKPCLQVETQIVDRVESKISKHEKLNLKSETPVSSIDMKKFSVI